MLQPQDKMVPTLVDMIKITILPSQIASHLLDPIRTSEVVLGSGRQEEYVLIFCGIVVNQSSQNVLYDTW